MSVNFTPTMKDYVMTPGYFKVWCQKVLPTVYDDSLSYYELLSKFVNTLNDLIANTEIMEENIGSLLIAYNELQEFVNHYFDNLDVQEEINKKLDAMSYDGSLTALIKQYVDPIYATYETRITDRVNGQDAVISSNNATQNARINVLETRMNGFENLPEGSTTGDAELIDIRNAADGMNYSTAGESVRKQIGVLNEELFDTVIPMTSPIAKTVVNNRFAGISGNKVTDYVANGYGYMVYDVSSIIKPILIRAIRQSGAFSFAFTDNDNNLICYDNLADSGVHSVEKIVYVPSGAKFLFVNKIINIITGYDYFYEKMYGAMVVEGFKTINPQNESWDECEVYDYTVNGAYINSSAGTHLSLNQADSLENAYTLGVKKVSKGEKYHVHAFSNYGVSAYVYCDKAYKVLQIAQTASVGSSFVLSDVDIDVTENGYIMFMLKHQTNKGTLTGKYAINKTISPLANVKIAYNGDSICESRFGNIGNNGGSYPFLISQATGCSYENRGLSGAVLASSVPSGQSSTPEHYIVDDIQNMSLDSDIICLEGGVNDHYYNVPLGEVTDNYSGTLDTNTVCGALESIFRQAKTRWIGKPIIFVIIHKCRPSSTEYNSAGYTWAMEREKLIEVCKKYAIPYYDAYEKSGVNPYLQIDNERWFTGGISGLPDGVHPNKEAYEIFYVPQLIKMFEEYLPIISN